MHVYDVENFDEHFHSWKVTMDNNPEVKIALFTVIFDYHIVGIHKLFENSEYLYANFRHFVTNEENCNF